MNRQTYMKILRFVSAIVGMSLLYISMQFSVDGFNFVVPSMVYIGWMLAFSITAIEFIWNKQGMSGNMTLLAVGLCAYAYGIYTNVLGIMAAQGADAFTLNAAVFPLILGLFLEVTPEALIVWALVGNSNEGDFVSNMASLFDSLFGRSDSNRGGHSKVSQAQGNAGDLDRWSRK